MHIFKSIKGRRRVPWAKAIIFISLLLAETVTAQAQAESFTDERGVTITLPAPARRIVSLSPELTESLYAVGAGNSVVGVTTYCNFPAAALSLPKIGGFSASTISIETIVSLRPDLVVGSLSAHGKLATAFERAGLRFAAMPTRDFEAVYSTLATFGRITGNSVKAEEVITSMRNRVQAVKTRTAAIPQARKPVVFWETWDEPLMSAGPGTFTGQIIEAAGGINSFADAQADWPVVSFEAVLARNPDWIMAAESHGAALTMERLSARPGWSSLKAVRNKKVALLDGDIVARAGPRFVEALEMMAAVLYPDLFPAR